MKSKKFFYGWIVVICCTLLAFSVNAMGNNTLSFYVTPVSETFGVNRATTNFALFTMGLFSRTLLGLFFGKLTARFGVKRLMITGLAFVLTGFIIYSNAQNIYMIGLGAALYGVAHAIGTLSSYNVIINNWFTKNKGIALGIVNTAVGAGGMVINPLVGGWIESYGWNQSFLYTAMVIAAIAIPSLIFIKESPVWNGRSEKEVPSAPSGKSDSKGADTHDGPVLTLRAALGLSRFRLLVVIQLLTGFAVGPCFTNTIPALRSMGIDPLFISNVLSVLLAFGIIVGHLTSGYLFDRFGLRALMTTAVCVVFTGMVSMGFISGGAPLPLLILTVMFIGYSNTLSLGTLSHTINNVFPEKNKDFSALFGCLFAVQNIGVMIGSPISGMFFDSTGSYQTAYRISAALLLVMFTLLLIALKMSGAKKAADRA